MPCDVSRKFSCESVSKLCSKRASREDRKHTSHSDLYSWRRHRIPPSQIHLNVMGAMATAEDRKAGGCFPSISALFQSSQKRVGMMEKMKSFRAPRQEVKLRNSFERAQDADKDDKVSEWHLPDEWTTDFKEKSIKK